MGGWPASLSALTRRHLGRGQEPHWCKWKIISAPGSEWHYTKSNVVRGVGLSGAREPGRGPARGWLTHGSSAVTGHTIKSSGNVTWQTRGGMDGLSLSVKADALPYPWCPIDHRGKRQGCSGVGVGGICSRGCLGCSSRHLFKLWVLGCCFFF